MFTPFMRKFLFTALSGIILFVSSAHAQIIYGPQIGVIYSTSVGGYSYYHYEWDYGYRAGAFAQLPVKKNQFLRSEIVFRMVGYKYQYTNIYPSGSVAVSGFLHAGYLQVPLLYERSFENGFHLDGGAFAECQLTQHWNEFTYSRSSIDSFNISTTELENSHAITANRFQAGLAAAIGFMKSGFDLSLGSQYNMTSLFPIDDETYKKQHLFTLALSLAYHIK
ncbi:MAG: hypothetical protein ACHQD9_05730 [Chitinophagales bacterium]